MHGRDDRQRHEHKGRRGRRPDQVGQTDDMTRAAFDEGGFGLEPAAALHAVEERVHGAGAEAKAELAELAEHAEAEDGLLGCGVEDVEADEAHIEILVLRRIAFGHDSLPPEFEES